MSNEKWFDDHVEVIGLSDKANKAIKAKLKSKMAAPVSLKKSVKIENAHATFVNDRAGWTWKVLKVYQKPELEVKNQYARWLVAAKSPNTYGSYEYGDTYVTDILQYARLESASPEFRAHMAARAAV